MARGRARELVRHAAELTAPARHAAGLELALKIAFPDLPLRVEDSGERDLAARAAPSKPAGERRPASIVYCDQPIGEPEQAAVATYDGTVKPVHVAVPPAREGSTAPPAAGAR